MLISGIVVLYNPNEGCIENIKTYLSLLNKLYIVDNSTHDITTVLKELCKLDKTEYIKMDGNEGIAKALKVGVEKSIAEGYDFCLTMDQDSKFPQTDRENLENILSIENILDYGIIGLNFNSDNTEFKLVDIKCWLTSGNFIVLENYKKIHGFKEELFIDYVDFDLDEQFWAIGKKVAYINNLSLIHIMGNPVKKRLLFKSFTVMNYTPIRDYYRFRNALYLYKQNKKFYRSKY